MLTSGFLTLFTAAQVIAAWEDMPLPVQNHRNQRDPGIVQKASGSPPKEKGGRRKVLLLRMQLAFQLSLATAYQ